MASAAERPLVEGPAYVDGVPGLRPEQVLVIIPAWNEEGSVAETVLEVRSTNPGVRVLVVDDGSSDATAERAREAGALVCSLPYNLGVGGAMRAGFRYALRHRFQVAVQIDADGQHDPRFLPGLLAGLAEANVVIGARFADKSETYQASRIRRFAMIVLARVLSAMAHTRLTDVTSGFRVADRQALRLFAEHYPADYLGDTVESLVIAVRSGLVVRQQPTQMRARQAGQASQSPLKASLYLARAVVALALALARRPPAPSAEGALQ